MRTRYYAKLFDAVLSQHNSEHKNWIAQTQKIILREIIDMKRTRKERIHHEATKALEMSLALLDQDDFRDHTAVKSRRCGYGQSDCHDEDSSSSLDHQNDLEDTSMLHSDDESQPFPNIEWADAFNDIPSLASLMEKPSVKRSSNSRDCNMHGISCRLHKLSLDKHTLHRSMAFMADLSSLDVRKNNWIEQHIKLSYKWNCSLLQSLFYSYRAYI